MRMQAHLRSIIGNEVVHSHTRKTQHGIHPTIPTPPFPASPHPAEARVSDNVLHVIIDIREELHLVARLVPIGEAYDVKQLEADTARLRKQLEEVIATQQKKLEAAAVAERKRQDDAAAAERSRQDREAASVRKQLNEEAEAERKRQDEEAAAQRARLDQEAAVERARRDEEAAAARKQLDEEAAAERARRDEQAAAARKQLDDEAAAERKRLEEAAAAERKRMADMTDIAGALFGPVRSGDPANQDAVQRAIIANRPAVAEAQPEPEAGAAVAQAAQDSAAAEELRRKREAEEAAERAAEAARRAAAAEQERQQQEKEAEAQRQAAASAAAEAEAAAEQKRQEEAKAAEQQERVAKLKALEEETPEALRARLPAKGASLLELPESILDLHDGMPAALRQAPMRLLRVEALLGWDNIKVYEEVDASTEAVELPYGSVSEAMWDATLILSWRWAAVKPTEYVPGFSPMSGLQFGEFRGVVARAAQLGVQFAWVDWCCVPQYKSDSMVEVLRSKVYYARARCMTVVPTFYPIPADGIVRLLLVKAARVIKRRAEGSPASPAALVAGRLDAMLAKEQVAGREYFSRVWTLAERMARFGRPERLCNWLSLEAWLGMLVDALLKSTDDAAASAIYTRILGPDAGALLRALLAPLGEAVRTGSMHVAGGLEEQLAELFELAVGIWQDSNELAEAPTPSWLLSYLGEAHSGVYAAWNDADRVWAVYSYFCWKQLDKGSKAGVLEGLQDLVRVAGGNRRHLMGMATKLGLAKLVEVDPVDRKLLEAAESDNLAGVQEALAEGAYPDAQQVDGRTALHYAAEKNNGEAARALLGAGAALEIKTSNAETPLFAAAAAGAAEVARVLLAAGAAVDPVGKAGFTPLHKATELGNDEMVRVLLAAGAKKEALTQSGDTPVAVAVRSGKDSVLRILADAGANKNFKFADGWTLLHEAAKQGHEGVVKMLLSFGVDKDAVNKAGCTPLHTAAQNNHVQVIKCLAEAGAKLEALIPNSKHTPLHEAAVNGKTEAAEALIAGGANKEARNKNQRTPLMVAACTGYHLTLKALIQAGCKKEAADNDNWRALHLAAHFNKYHAVKALLEAGANGNAKTSKGSIPHEVTDDRSIKALLPKPPPVTFFGLF